MRMPHDETGTGSESRLIFEAFVEAGGNLIDTADAYGEAEVLTRELVGADRERIVIGSKFTPQRRAGDVNSAGSHRKNLVGALEASLRRLGSDYLDIYWVHARDVLTPVEETMRALDDQVRAARCCMSEFPTGIAWEIAQANTAATLRGWTAFTGTQVPYSLAERTVERELIPMAAQFDLAVTAWSPLGGGKLARGVDDPVTTALDAVAGEVGATSSQVALAWLRSRPGGVIPIVGASRGQQMRENLGALDVELSADHLQALDRVSAVDLGFPGAFLAGEHVQDAIYGTHRARLPRTR